MKFEKSCGAVISAKFSDCLKVLLIRHKNGGHWAFPKGHMEGNETEEQTALREIREETGLSVTLDTGFRAVITYSPKDHVMKDVVYFAATADLTEGIPQPEEVLEIKWMTIKDALNTVTFENDRQVLRKYADYLGQTD